MEAKQTHSEKNQEEVSETEASQVKKRRKETRTRAGNHQSSSGIYRYCFLFSKKILNGLAKGKQESLKNWD